jgi:hypothetical protein
MMTEAQICEQLRGQDTDEDLINDLCENEELSEKIMYEFADILNWNMIIMHQKMTKELIEENSNYIDWCFASYNKDLLPEIFHKEFQHKFLF